MSHTREPWRVEAVSNAVRIVIGKGRKKVILARLNPPQLPEKETWANARLMVLAPEFLETCKLALDSFSDTARPGSSDDWQLKKAVCERLRAVILKAEAEA